MTEDDYVLATDLAKLRAAVSIMSDMVNPPYEEMRGIVNLADRLAEKVGELEMFDD